MFPPLASLLTGSKRALAALALLALIPISLYLGLRLAHKDSRFRAAQDALDANDLPRARQELLACVEADQPSPEVFFLLARTERRLSFFQDAQSHLAAYLRLGGEPNLVDLERHLQDAQRGVLESCEARLLECVEKKHPDTVLIWEALVEGYIRDKRPDDALACLGKWLEFQPDSPIPWLLHGRTLEIRQDFGSALSSYRRAVQLAPGNQVAHLFLAEQLLTANQIQEAMDEYRYLTQAAPFNPKVSLGIARALCARSQIKEAKEELASLLARDPSYGPGLLFRGRLEFDAGNAAEAEPWLRRALTHMPCSKEAHYNLAVCLNAQGKKVEAERLQQRLQSIEKDFKAYYTFAIEASVNRRDPMPRCEAGIICLRIGKEAEGVRLLEAALRLDPRYELAHRALASYYRGKGQAEAAALHENALRAKPG
jgi:tetratricopeptide (TPR) repeat protein